MDVRATIFLFLALPALAFPQFTARVIGVSDGDSIQVRTVRSGRVETLTVRLDGIDAPEMNQPYGISSKWWLSGRLLDQRVTIRRTDTDSYGRMVARVIRSGRDISAESVRAGMAWWYRDYAKADKALQKAESEARRARRGLWSQPRPIAPWEWRRGGAVRWAIEQKRERERKERQRQQGGTLTPKGRRS